MGSVQGSVPYLTRRRRVGQLASCLLSSPGYKSVAGRATYVQLERQADGDKLGKISFTAQLVGREENEQRPPY